MVKRCDPEIRMCQHCGDEYVTEVFSQMFCSAQCNSQHQRDMWMFDPLKRMSQAVHSAKSRAKRKGLAFNLTPEYMMELWEEQGGRCVLTDATFDLQRDGDFQHNPDAPTIDRIVPSLGYIKGNVRILTYQVNMALSEWGEERFELMIKRYINNGGLL